MSPPPALIFDLDGTLIDSLPDLAAAVNRLLAAEGLAPMARAEVQSYVGDGAPALVHRVMAARGLAAERHADLTTRLVADYSALPAELTTVYPHVFETLTNLRQHGHPLGLCTNKPGAATGAVLSALGLALLFDVVISGDSLPERKPHPAPLLAAIDRLGAPAIFVGDSEVDARTAEAAGLPFFLFTKGYLRVPLSEISVTATFDDFADFRELIATLPATP
ncbi:phosphoglycolate phosphatase [Frigidibacter sp. RF13]|uniref:phosphoglycolate phosphatase n=1 Tax=Frigidibacter sp. RF13 TaxID=2997340 RepID=UPI0022706CB5|nr:phosphoglycolate phosphatase [Frigidibacter sp. RF13]MCY1125648.1 phosphoglycolate phosphatase [Frigidibacter sp. RF13]